MKIFKHKDIKPVLGLKKTGYNVDCGVLPHVSFYYRKIAELPIITFANVGYTPAENGLGHLTTVIKRLCGYGWANGIEGLHYYDGSSHSYPFHVHVFFKDFSVKRICGAQVPIVKSAFKYEFTLYSPITSLPIFSFSENLQSWNSRMSPEANNRVGEVIYRYEGAVMGKCRTFANEYKTATAGQQETK
jgi:hypothetical protein